MLTIGCIDYVNSLPLFYGLTQKIINSEANFLFGPPTFINNKFESKEANISLVSSVTYLKNKNHLKLIKPFGIAAKSAVKSVLLYRKTKKPKTIALTDESATSVELLKILCKEKWNIQPQFVVTNNFKQQEAFLVIGDRALKEKYLDYETVDLALEWYNLFELPFTFALVAAHMETPNETIKKIEEIFHYSLAWSESHQESILNIAKKKLNVPREFLRDYFAHLNYRLGDLEIKSLELFETHLNKSHHAANLR